MALIVDRVRVPIDVNGETVTLICRRPGAKETSDFLSNRFVTRRNKVESRLYEARATFVNNILVDAEGAEFNDATGETKALNASTILSDDDKRHWSGVLGEPVQTWKDLIPLNWKSSAAMYFEDQASGDSGN